MSRLFATIDVNDSDNASIAALQAASELSSRGINVLIIESLGAKGTNGNVRFLSDLKSHINGMDAKSLRGYLASGSARIGRMMLDDGLFDSQYFHSLSLAYELIISVDRAKDLLDLEISAVANLRRHASDMPALFSVKASEDGDISYAGRNIKKLLEDERAPRPAGFVISPHDLSVASHLSRKWKIASWGDLAGAKHLADKILKRAVLSKIHSKKCDHVEAEQKDDRLTGLVRDALGILREDSDFKAMDKPKRDKVGRCARRIVGAFSHEQIKDIEPEKIVSKVVDEACGFGPIDHLLAESDITEIMVCGPENIYIERGGRIERASGSFYDDEHLMAVIERMLMPAGRRIDEATPFADARLTDGSRVHAIIPPLAIDGPHLTVRRFLRTISKMDEAVECKMLSIEAACFLSSCVRSRISIVVSGGTGAGKTTLLNVLASQIDHAERIITIEDAAELKINLPHVVRLEARPCNIEGVGQVTIRDLVRNALRMRPDRIVVGECRGAEALDMLQAMNTGHEGSLTTVHANSSRDALARLETMVLMADLALPLRAIREQVSRAVDLIVQVSRMEDGSRRVVEIAEVTGMEGDVISMQTLAQLGDGGVLEMTGLKPCFVIANDQRERSNLQKLF
ncbi:MAG: CpaF family protein [Pseudomonadota bacterium]